MRQRIYSRAKGPSKFFLIALSHDDMFNHYTTNFHLMVEHKLSLTELELMMPWEREVYVSMLNNHLKEKQKILEKANKR